MRWRSADEAPSPWFMVLTAILILIWLAFGIVTVYHISHTLLEG